MAQCYNTPEQANYGYVTSTNYYNPGTTETYHKETYAKHHEHGYGNHGIGGQAHYGQVAHNGQHHKEHDIIKTHTESFSTHGTGYGHHHKARTGHHGSGKIHASISERKEIRIKKKRADGCSDYSSDSCSDSDHE